MPILIVEGTCGAGKTMLSNALARREGVQLLPQRLTYGVVAPLEQLRALDDGLNHVLLGRLVDWLKRNDRPERWMVVDSLHLTQWVRPGVLGLASFASIDKQLARIGARGVLLTVSPELVRQRAITGRANTPFRTYAAKWAPDDETLHARFVKEQETMREVCGISLMKWDILDGGLPVDALADAVWSLVGALPPP
jgi:hypothetical protein